MAPYSTVGVVLPKERAIFYLPLLVICMMSFDCDLCDVYGAGILVHSNDNGFMCGFWLLLFLHCVVASGRCSALLQQSARTSCNEQCPTHRL